MNSSTKCITRVNPSTKRCVLRHGKIGRHLVGRPKSCPSVINPKTNRCIRKDGKLHRKISKKSSKKSKKSKKSSKKSIKKPLHPKIEPICVPEKFQDIANRCACKKQWIIKKHIGSGAYGKVYGACFIKHKQKICEYAVKIQKYDRFGRAEINAYLDFKKLNINKQIQVAPKFYAAWICRNKIYIVLQKMYTCTQIHIQQIQNIANTLQKYGWIHADIHKNNIMCNKKRKNILIDFNWAVKKGKQPYQNQPNKNWKQLKTQQNTQIQILHNSNTTTTTR